MSSEPLMKVMLMMLKGPDVRSAHMDSTLSKELVLPTSGRAAGSLTCSEHEILPAGERATCMVAVVEFVLPPFFALFVFMFV